MRTMQRVRRRRDDEAGVVAIEFVLVAPLLFLLIFGVIQFGRGFNAKIELTGAVREGARALALGTGDPETVTLDAAPGLDSSSIVVTTSDDPCTEGSEVWVRASYPFDLNVPFWGNESVTIEAKGVMRCRG